MALQRLGGFAALGSLNPQLAAPEIVLIRIRRQINEIVSTYLGRRTLLLAGSDRPGAGRIWFHESGCI
jgi:hypothetical protein